MEEHTKTRAVDPWGRCARPHCLLLIFLPFTTDAGGYPSYVYTTVLSIQQQRTDQTSNNRRHSHELVVVMEGVCE